MKQVQLGLMIIFFLCFGCKGKGKEKEFLVGKWKNYREEFRNGSDTTSSGDKLNPFLRWQFTDEEFIEFWGGTSKDKYKYQLKQDTIYINGQPSKIIEKLVHDTLVIMHIGKDGIDESNTRSFFIRVEKFGEDIIE